MSQFLQDLRIGARRLLRSPGFSVSALAVLALGIGANTANFSVVNAVLFRPLPYADADRLLHLFRTEPQRGLDSLRFSLPLFVDLQAGAEDFSALGAYSYGNRNLDGGDGDPENLTVGRLTSNLLPILGVRPALGRAFTEDEGRPGEDRVALLSDGLWRRRFGARPDVVGAALQLDGEAFTVVGVMAPDFNFPYGEVKLWTPLALDARKYGPAEDFLLPVGRLRPGVSAGAAQARLAALFDRLKPAYPSLPADGSLRVVPLRQALVFFYDTVRPMMLLGMVAHLFVLLIVCANVASLMLSHAVGQQRAIALRSALGASRGRLIRQLLTEGLVLAVVAAALGSGLAFWVTTLVRGLIPEGLYRVGTIAVDGQALLFALAVALFTTLLFALAPAFEATRIDLVEALKERGGGSAGRRAGRLRNALIVAEVAAAVVLLVGTVMTVQSFDRLRRVDPGFQAGSVLTMEVRITKAQYPTPEASTAFFSELIERTRAIPGVAAAAVVDPLPLNFEADEQRFEVEGRAPASPDEKLYARSHAVSADYFRVMGIPMLAGRGFDDRPGSPVEVVVDRAFAATYWPQAAAVGERLRLLGTGGGEPVVATIVGVAGDTKNFLVNETATAILYLPQSLQPPRRNFLVVRAAGSPLALAAGVREAVRAVGPGVPVTKVRSMAQVVGESVQPWDIAARVLAALAVLALVLAGLGIYGVVAYGVSRRVREIGIRVALGASRGRIASMILGHGARLAAVGLGLGLLLALGVARLLGKVLFGVGSFSPVALAASALLLAATAVVASLVPACRALRLDPTAALRAE